MLAFESTSIESIEVTVTSRVDIDAAPPEFQLTDIDATSPTGAWVAGVWQSVSGGSGKALTPLIGAGQPLDVVEGSNYKLWIRWSAATETPVRPVDSVRVR